MSEAAQKIIEFFEALSPHSVERFGEIYTEDAFFKDPFNEVRGLVHIQPIFRHMYANLLEPRFAITACIEQEGQVFLTWNFRFRMRRFQPDCEQVIQGASHLLLASDGRIRSHRDYWDAAEELYEKLPLVGALMRWLRRRANA